MATIEQGDYGKLFYYRYVSPNASLVPPSFMASDCTIPTYLVSSGQEPPRGSETCETYRGTARQSPRKRFRWAGKDISHAELDE